MNKEIKVSGNLTEEEIDKICKLINEGLGHSVIIDREVTAFSRLPIDTVNKIPDNVIIPCPKKGTINKLQINRMASKCCPDCEHFRGLARLVWADNEEEDKAIMKKIDSGEVLWSDVFAVRCATIYEIPCQTIDERDY